MSTTIGILSIVVAFGLLIVLSYKGMSVMYVAPLCALLVALVNGIPLLDASPARSSAVRPALSAACSPSSCCPSSWAGSMWSRARR